MALVAGRLVGEHLSPVQAAGLLLVSAGILGLALEPGSFGVGGYHRTPIEEVLPVRLKAPDEEEKQSAAVAIVTNPPIE